jgi:hypothetical protein
VESYYKHWYRLLDSHTTLKTARISRMPVTNTLENNVIFANLLYITDKKT